MEYTSLPGSDLNVSGIGLGTWLFGGRRWGNVDDADSMKTIEAALARGVTFFDTADAYGAGRAESMLGDALRGARHRVVIATKVGVVWHDDGSRSIALSPSHIERAVEESLRRLKTDYIDLYQLHAMDPATSIADTGKALKKLRENGVVRHIGVSNFEVDAIDALRAIVPVLTTQSEYSLLKRDIEGDLVPYCARHGVSVLTYSPLSRGLLSGKFTDASTFPETDNRFHDDEFRGETFRQNLKKVGHLTEMARQLGHPPAAVAIRWLLEQPSVGAVICGARTPGQLEENLGAVGWRLPAAALDALADHFAR
jgi:aryl-alcohol dehydrogenase-like predicted oxidoreductase